MVRNLFDRENYISYTLISLIINSVEEGLIL